MSLRAVSAFIGLLVAALIVTQQLQVHYNARKHIIVPPPTESGRPETTLGAAAALSISSNGHSIDSTLKDLIKRLPKAELHIHIEGTLEPEQMLQMAARNNITLPYHDLAEAKAARAHYADLQSFLDAYQIALSVLVTEQDFKDLAAGYLDKAAAQNITHAEIFFDAQSHANRGVPVSAVINGLQSAINERRTHPSHPIDASLILCLVRNLGQFAAAVTLSRCLPYLRHISALGLASAEVGYPPEAFKEVFTSAGLLGLHKVAHAGEEGGPEYVWGALKALGAQRIDHGIHSLDDPELVAYMAQQKIPITLCPLSNLKLQVYGAALPDKLREVLSSGIVVTINSDDPAYFNGYLNANYEYIASIGALGPDDIAKLARNSFAASFIPGEQKLAAFEQIRQVLLQWKAEQVNVLLRLPQQQQQQQ